MCGRVFSFTITEDFGRVCDSSYSEEKFQVVMVVAIKEMTGRKSVKIHWNLNWFSHFGFLLPSTTEKKKFEPDWLVGNQKKRSHAKSNPLHKFHDQIPSGTTFNDPLKSRSYTTQCSVCSFLLIDSQATDFFDLIFLWDFYFFVGLKVLGSM